MNKLIFLDVDGVLNNYSYASSPDLVEGTPIGFGGWFRDEEPPHVDNVKWDPDNVAALQSILTAVPDVQVVISSTWREAFTVGTFNKMFELYDLPQIVVGATPIHAFITEGVVIPGSPRGSEIKEYLNTRHKNQDVRYVILDDNNDMLPEQQAFFVQTDEMWGLTQTDANRAIEILTSVVDNKS